MGGDPFPLSTTMVMTITTMTTAMYNQECITTWKCDLQVQKLGRLYLCFLQY
jgi:hypothetical protein